VNESAGDLWPASNIHPTHAIYPELDAKKPIRPGEAWAFTFDRVGYWRIHNHLAPEKGGLVVVQGDSAADVEPLVMDLPKESFDDPPAMALKDLNSLFESDAALERAIRQYGPHNAVELLFETTSHVTVDCHQRAHVVGRMSYDIFGAAAFSLASHECQAGAFHGAMEALIRDRGIGTLASDVATLCGAMQGKFFRHQCVHGVGHGLLAWTTYELPDALEVCDTLQTVLDRYSCYSGAFMENVVGGLAGTMGHKTAFLSDDPHFP